MHLVCPKCATSYQLDATTVGATGRSVRCTRCKNVWFAAASDLQPVTADAARDEAAFRAELGAGTARAAAANDSSAAADQPSPGMAAPGIAEGEPAQATSARPSEAAAPPPLSDINVPAVDAPPLSPSAADAAPEAAASPIPSEPEDIESVAARRMPATPVIARRRTGNPKSRLALVVLALVAVCAAIIGWRKDIVRHVPQMASFYGTIGLPVNLRGLVFTEIRTANEAHDGVPVLTVEGTVESIVSYQVEVPRLRFALRNTAGLVVYSWTAVPPQTVLNPGEALPFRSRLASPPGDVHDVQVRFFNRRDAAAGVR
jgi:predicted Zn finger-like uncharacterized protein